jgi:YD repeat-containing protein
MAVIDGLKGRAGGVSGQAVGGIRRGLLIPSGGTTNLSYDADGNTLTDPGHTYTYDRLDRLSTATWPDGSTLSISYDPLGLRNEEVLKNFSGTVIADNKLLWQSGKIVSDGTNNYWSFGQTTGNSQYYFGTTIWDRSETLPTPTAIWSPHMITTSGEPEPESRELKISTSASQVIG